jgi:hypothetical protein
MIFQMLSTLFDRNFVFGCIPNNFTNLQPNLCHLVDRNKKAPKPGQIGP